MKHPTVALLGVGMLSCAAALPAGQLVNTAQDDPVPAAAQSTAPTANPFLGGTGFSGFGGSTGFSGFPGFPGFPGSGAGFGGGNTAPGTSQAGPAPSPATSNPTAGPWGFQGFNGGAGLGFPGFGASGGFPGFPGFGIPQAATPPSSGVPAPPSGSPGFPGFGSGSGFGFPGFGGMSAGGGAPSNTLFPSFMGFPGMIGGLGAPGSPQAQAASVPVTPGPAAVPASGEPKANEAITSTSSPAGTNRLGIDESNPAPPLDNGGTTGQGMVQPGSSPGMPDVGTGFNVGNFSSAFLEGGALPSPTLAVDSVAGPAATSTTTPSDSTVASATSTATPNASSTTSAE